MPSSAGVVPVLCPNCSGRFFEHVATLLEVSASTCPKCGTTIPAAELESRDATLARVLTVLREQRKMHATQPRRARRNGRSPRNRPEKS
jgi:uncharacterized protein (UPF0212 family)